MGLFVEYEISGSSQTLLTANIHAINFVSAKKYEHMLSEVEAVLKRHVGPVILAGDFNSWSNKRVRALHKMTERLELNQLSFKDDSRTRWMGKVVDWIFVRGLKVNNMLVHAEIKSSDHNALTAELSLIR